MDGPARSLGTGFDPFSEIYLADPYPFLAEARYACVRSASYTAASHRLRR
jgi:hypothetical protein